MSFISFVISSEMLRFRQNNICFCKVTTFLYHNVYKAFLGTEFNYLFDSVVSYTVVQKMRTEVVETIVRPPMMAMEGSKAKYYAMEGMTNNIDRETHYRQYCPMLSIKLNVICNRFEESYTEELHTSCRVGLCR